MGFHKKKGATPHFKKIENIITNQERLTEDNSFNEETFIVPIIIKENFLLM